MSPAGFTKRVFQNLSIMFGKKSLGPSYPERPIVNENFESNVEGMYIIGDVSGTPLIKMTLNQGFELANRLLEKLSDKKSPEGVYDVLVVGAGCAGLGALRQLKKKGARALCLESNQAFMTIRNFTKGKPIYLEPLDMDFHDSWAMTEGTRETILEQAEKIIEDEALPIQEFEKVTNVKKGSDGIFDVQTERDSYRARFVILAIGKSGNPRKAGVPGEAEFLQKIHHRLIDLAEYQDQDILVYGGGDVALEAAIALAPSNRVTLVTIDKELTFPKKRNKEKLFDLEKQDQVRVHLNSKLLGIGEKDVGIQVGENSPSKIPNDVVFEMIGAELPLPFLRKCGLNLESDWPVKRILGMVACLVFVYLIYAWKSGFKPFYYGQFINHLPSVLKAPSFWYSLLYTLLMLIFGIVAMKRWNRGGKDTYQTYRFISLIVFQIISFIGIEVILAIMIPKYYWRFYGINNPFPLLFDTFFNWKATDPATLKWSLIGACFAMTFIIIPIAVRYHGKRFCTWICGCGGLAETFGDRWRHLSPKGIRAEKWEVVGDIIMFWAFISSLIILIGYSGNSSASGFWHSGYRLIVDFWLVAVIPVGLYPFFGGKVWCRFWCPLAKYMQILSRWYGTLQISSNDKCISCTQCSTYCEVGVDVMAFAKNGEAFDNRNSSCIQCGICITVCPMDVLSFDNDARKPNEPQN